VQRRGELPQAHAIVRREVARFTDWQRRREAVARAPRERPPNQEAREAA
jgi:glutamyl-tRNA reductase